MKKTLKRLLEEGYELKKTFGENTKIDIYQKNNDVIFYDENKDYIIHRYKKMERDDYK